MVVDLPLFLCSGILDAGEVVQGMVSFSNVADLPSTTKKSALVV